MSGFDTVGDVWTAIDFETATRERHSACALGVAVIQEGVVVSSGAWLIQPPGNTYEAQNVSVHGITPAMTRRSATYPELYDAIAPFLEGRFLVAHWAPFDVSVLRTLHEYYGIPLPRANYVCSCAMSRRAFPALVDHRLPTVCSHCGIPLQHHEAASDALACAHVTLGCVESVGAETVHEAVGSLGLSPKRL